MVYGKFSLSFPNCVFWRCMCKAKTDVSLLSSGSLITELVQLILKEEKTFWKTEFDVEYKYSVTHLIRTVRFARTG